MKIIEVITKKDKNKFIKFRQNLYHNDLNYVCTDNFVLKDILFTETKFAKSCVIKPIIVLDNQKIVAQAILIYTNLLNKVQISFFDALENQFSAVELIKEAAINLNQQVAGKGIIIGLNGHISYGVGILTSGFEYKNSFDSIYNKCYYKKYFNNLRSESLSTYKQKFYQASALFSTIDLKGIKIRKCSLKNFAQEMALLRTLCEKTIAKTNLYFPTDEGHFFELTRDLKPFLKSENLLFAENQKGETIGFLFSHPDFNQMLKGGRDYSLLGIGIAFIFNKNKIDTMKINAIGTLNVRATAALLNAFNEIFSKKYQYLETNFIWDNNNKSAAIARKFLGSPHRKYEVYYLNES